VLPARAEHLTWVEVDGDVVILDLRHGDLHLLDRTAAAVWARLGAGSIDELVGALSADFGTDAATVRTDVHALLARLRDLGLLREATGGWPTREHSSTGRSLA
jgi:PqqD family protein of HPr-rel-A system